VRGGGGIRSGGGQTKYQCVSRIENDVTSGSEGGNEEQEEDTMDPIDIEDPPDNDDEFPPESFVSEHAIPTDTSPSSDINDNPAPSSEATDQSTTISNISNVSSLYSSILL